MMIVAAAVALSVLGHVTLPLEAWRSDPAVEIQDAYKWIYQATQGGEHAVPSPEQAAAWLQKEWAALDSDPSDEPLVEPLGDSGIVRLNLRPYRAAGGAPEALVAAFLRSAAAFKPDREEFERTWIQLGERLRQGAIGRLTRAAWERVDAEARPSGYPAVHHSAGFNASRRPAYRVLTETEARRMLVSLAPNSSGGRNQVP
jgi:hypothetical protein